MDYLIIMRCLNDTGWQDLLSLILSINISSYVYVSLKFHSYHHNYYIEQTTATAFFIQSDKDATEM